MLGEKISDTITTMSMTKFFRFFADTFFAKRYGHRISCFGNHCRGAWDGTGMWLHLKSLRKAKTGYVTIRELLSEMRE